jgi:hypothetical protein
MATIKPFLPTDHLGQIWTLPKLLQSQHSCSHLCPGVWQLYKHCQRTLHPQYLRREGGREGGEGEGGEGRGGREDKLNAKGGHPIVPILVGVPIFLRVSQFVLTFFKIAEQVKWGDQKLGVVEKAGNYESLPHINL